MGANVAQVTLSAGRRIKSAFAAVLTRVRLWGRAVRARGKTAYAWVVGLPLKPFVKNHRTALIKAAAGFVFAVGGAWLCWPAFFASSPEPPTPWGLWLGVSYANSSFESPQLLAHISLIGGPSCGDPTLVTVSATDLYVPDQARPPRPITVLVVTSSGSGAGGYASIGGRGVALTRSNVIGAAASVGRLQWNGFDPITMRFQMPGLMRSAGYRSCYLRAPELFSPAASTAAWTVAAKNANRWQEAQGLAPTVVAPVGAAILSLAVRGKTPDLAAGSTQATIIGRSIRLSCTSQPPRPNPDDPSYLPRIAATKSNCGGVARFETEGSTNVLNVRVFFAGIALSTAIALILEALFGERRRAADLATG